MYISYQGQQAIHQDIVNGALKRSEQRRLRKESEQCLDRPASGGSRRLGSLPSNLVRLFTAMSTRGWISGS